MADLKIIKPKDLQQKIRFLIGSGVIAVFVFALIFSRIGASFIGMLVLMLFCAAPVMFVVIARVNRNKLTIAADQFQVVQGMATVVVRYSEVQSLTLQQRNLQSYMGPTALSMPMLVFMTGSGEKEFLFTQYRTDDLAFLINSLLSCNPNVTVAEDVQKLLNNETKAIKEQMKTKFNYIGSLAGIAIAVIVYLLLTGKIRIPW